MNRSESARAGRIVMEVQAILQAKVVGEYKLENSHIMMKFSLC